MKLSLIAALTLWTASALAAVNFTGAFAPQDGLVNRYENPARDALCLNGSWQFQGADTAIPGDTAPALGAWDRVAIKIPSPWNVNAFEMENGGPGGDFRAYPSYPKAWETLPAAWMQRTIAVPAAWQGRRIVLHFGAVGGKLVAYVNGQRVGEGFDIFFAQEFDVTKFIRPGADNQILVKVIGSKNFDRPGRMGRREYLSGSFWGTFLSGLWQDVYLRAEPTVAVSDIFVQPLLDQDTLRVEVTVANHGTAPANVGVSGTVSEWINLALERDKTQPPPGTISFVVMYLPEVKWKLAEQPSLALPAQPIQPIALAPGETKTVILTAPVGGKLKTWTPAAPNLYGLLVKLSTDGKTVDTKYQRFGWRQFAIRGSQFFLNGQPIVLRGDAWHYMGVPQMTRRYACAWYQLLKDAGANAVRLHASVYPEFYHDMADEMGLMVLDETAIWLSDGGPKVDSDLFWTNCRVHVVNLVRRDRNHPSVFGWSVCNEILPVLRNVWHAPQSLVDKALDEIGVWKELCLTNDPTRQWISGDGEWDAEGRLPTINIHYGGEGEMQRAAQSGKPWAVGEASMAYYGTPKQVSQFNGNRAYESAEGRMEGLAYECYGLLTAQQKYGAAYQSVFNIAWYAIRPLPFGKPDVTKPNALDQGIFFGAFQENVPGMQPERLGPYVSNLNPGYDPALPLYRPWPMFDAIHDANTGNTASPWAQRPPKTVTPASTATGSTNVVVSFLPDNGARLAQELSRAGIKMTPFNTNGHTDFLILDGSAAPIAEANAALKEALGVLVQGGTVWAWNIKPENADVPNFSAEPRVASSFIVKKDSPLTAGLDNAGLYFSEGDDWQQMSYGLGLGGKMLDDKDTEVLLEACPADWRQWNYKGEPVKTGALYRSEVENTAPRAVLINYPVGQGRLILCNLSPEIKSTHKLAVLQQLFRNAGIQPEQVTDAGGFTDLSGRLVRALVSGSFGVDDLRDAYGEKLPAGSVTEGADWNGKKWRVANAGEDGVFDFKKGLVRGPQDNAYAYLAVWIKSPKPLNDLLSEPNLPKLTFTFGSDDGCQVWLNGELLATHDRVGPMDPDAFTINPLLLKLGWNQLVIKVVQGTGEWKFTGRFGSTDVNFLSKLEFSTEKPEGK